MSRSSMFTRVALAIALLFVAGSFLEAQDREGRRGRGGRGGFFGGRGGTEDKVSLIRREEVQKEIKVTEAQLGKIEGIVADYREASRGLFSEFGNFRDMSREERDEVMEKVNAKREKLAAEYGKKVDGLLEKPQIKRLNEIALQQKGVQGLTDAPVAAALKLSEEQVGKIKGIFKSEEEAQQKLRTELFGDGGRGREGFAEWQEKRTKLQEETKTKALAVLSEEQQKQFTALQGEKFELQRRRGAGFGRGGEGRGGRGDRGGREGGGGGQRRRPPVDDA